MVDGWGRHALPPLAWRRFEATPPPWAPRACLQVTGFRAYSNVSGTRVLATFGIDASKLTTWIVVLDCLYPACLALAFALLYWHLPRPQALRRRGGGGAAAH